jgi:hypothetical protein
LLQIKAPVGGREEFIENHSNEEEEDTCLRPTPF